MGLEVLYCVFSKLCTLDPKLIMFQSPFINQAVLTSKHPFSHKK
jgi:hypothetical protein